LEVLTGWGGRCLLCDQFFEASDKGAVNTSNLTAHLTGFHKMKRAQFLDDAPAHPGSRGYDARDSQPHSTKRQATFPLSVDHSRITQLLLDVILAGALPFNFVSNPALHSLFAVLQPSYRIPHRITFARRCDERYIAVLAEEKAKFVAHGASGISLQVRALLTAPVFSCLLRCCSRQFDHWTESVTHRPYITVCASRCDGDELLPVSRTVGTAYTPLAHTGLNIAADVRTHLSALGVETGRAGVLFAATTDTASSMPNAVADLGLLWKPCDAHLLNLVLKFPFTNDLAPPSVAPVARLQRRPSAFSVSPALSRPPTAPV
jgi:hypothetical protein